MLGKQEQKQQQASPALVLTLFLNEMPFGESQKQREGGVHGRGIDLSGLRVGGA